METDNKDGKSIFELDYKHQLSNGVKLTNSSSCDAIFDPPIKGKQLTVLIDTKVPLGTTNTLSITYNGGEKFQLMEIRQDLIKVSIEIDKDVLELDIKKVKVELIAFSDFNVLVSILAKPE